MSNLYCTLMYCQTAKIIQSSSLTWTSWWMSWGTVVRPLLEQSAVCLPELHLQVHKEGHEERKSEVDKVTRLPRSRRNIAVILEIRFPQKCFNLESWITKREGWNSWPECYLWGVELAITIPQGSSLPNKHNHSQWDLSLPVLRPQHPAAVECSRDISCFKYILLSVLISIGWDSLHFTATEAFSLSNFPSESSPRFSPPAPRLSSFLEKNTWSEKKECLL